MPGPLAGVKFIHNAFRMDLTKLQADIKFFATLGDGDADELAKRVARLNEILYFHEKGEELVLFPAVNSIEPGIADVYEKTHREIDPLREGLLEALQRGDADKAFDCIMELKPKMDAHLAQEEQELVPWCDEHFSFPDQGRMAGEMSKHIPQEKMAELVPWMVRTLNADDRVGVMQMWKEAMPAPVFGMISGMVKGALTEQQWNDLAGPMPELA